MLTITTKTTTTMTNIMNEERNVLDDLLDNGDDEDFDAELKAARNFDPTRLATKTTTIARKSKNFYFFTIFHYDFVFFSDLDLKKKSTTKQSLSTTVKDNGNKVRINLKRRDNLYYLYSNYSPIIIIPQIDPLEMETVDQHHGNQHAIHNIVAIQDPVHVKIIARWLMIITHLQLL